MENNAKEIAKLLLKQRSGDITTEERQQLQTWLQSAERYQDLANSLNDSAFMEEQLRLYNRISIPPPEVTLRRLQQKPTLVPLRRRIKRYFPYAAALLLSIGAMSAWYLEQRNNTEMSQQEVQNDIGPGGNKATLILSNGNTIALRSDQDGIAIGEDGIRYRDGATVSDLDQVNYATLHVPRGGQYQLTLPDGTKVWLNADTKLSYPTAFKAKERVVKLEGEAYFEVSPNKAQPFLVEFDEHTIRVLGTAFNVKAYPEQQQGITTLVDGRIALGSKDGPFQTLRPNQQAMTSDQGISIKEVNAQHYVVWKDGVIVLDRQDILSIIPQLERWYDVEFDRDAFPAHSLTLSGEIPRDISLSAVLAVLGEQLKFKFEIKGRKVIVKS